MGDVDAVRAPTPDRRTAVRRALTPFSVVLIVALSAQPFAAFLAANGPQVTEVGRLIQYMVVTAAVGCASLAALSAVFPRISGERLAVVVGLVITSFFSFELLMGDGAEANRELLQVAVWLVLTAAVVTLGYRLAARDLFRRGLVVFAVVYLAVPTVTAVSDRRAVELAERPAEVAAGGVDPIVGEAPNVYWFVLDEYGRNDQLQSIIGFDNSAFYDDLRDLGFTVFDRSRANYPRTHLSLSSTLQMDYVAEPGNQLDKEYAQLAPVLRGDNNTVRRFEAHGYDFVYSDHGSFAWLDCSDEIADLCLPAVEPPRATDELQKSLLKLTPLRSLGIFSVPYTQPVQVLDELDRRVGAVEEPFFLFAHIGVPHWPYRYDDTCTPRDVPRDAYQLSPQDRAAAYVQDVECLNDLTVEALTRIVEDDPDAVVIVQSDHGSTFLLDWDLPLEEWSDEALQERFSVINAMRLPSRCGLDPEPAFSLVNTFRVVFACLEGTEADLLEDRQFLSPYDRIEQVEEVPAGRFEGPSG